MPMLPRLVGVDVERFEAQPVGDREVAHDATDVATAGEIEDEFEPAAAHQSFLPGGAAGGAKQTTPRLTIQAEIAGWISRGKVQTMSSTGSPCGVQIIGDRKQRHPSGDRQTGEDAERAEWSHHRDRRIGATQPTHRAPAAQ